MLSRATHIVHDWIRTLVRPGDRVVDATCGNGHDTLLLASCCLPGGRLWALDIQASAVEQTRQRLKSNGLADGLTLHHLSHDAWETLPDAEGPLRCVVFNLGYLPGSDKQIMTMADVTVKAHQRFMAHLGSGGVILTTAYTGHAGGQEEADVLVSWARSLDPADWSVARFAWINQPASAPFILTIQRRN